MEVNVCPICCDIVVLPLLTQCSHTFHKLCFYSWVSRGNLTCPMCRHPIERVNPNEIFDTLFINDAIEISSKISLVLNKIDISLLKAILPVFFACETTSGFCFWEKIEIIPEAREPQSNILLPLTFKLNNVNYLQIEPNTYKITYNHDLSLKIKMFIERLGKNIGDKFDLPLNNIIIKIKLSQKTGVGNFDVKAIVKNGKLTFEGVSY